MLDNILDKLVSELPVLSKQAATLQVMTGFNLATQLGLEPLHERIFYLEPESIRAELDTLLTSNDFNTFNRLNSTPAILRYIYATLYILESKVDLVDTDLTSLVVELCLDPDFLPYQYTQLVSDLLTDDTDEYLIELDARAELFYLELATYLVQALGKEWWLSKASLLLTRLISSYVYWATNTGIERLVIYLESNSMPEVVLTSDYPFIDYVDYLKLKDNHLDSNPTLAPTEEFDLLSLLDEFKLKDQVVLGLLTFNSLVDLEAYLALVGIGKVVDNTEFKTLLDKDNTDTIYFTYESDYTLLLAKVTTASNLREAIDYQTLTKPALPFKLDLSLVTNNTIGSYNAVINYLEVSDKFDLVNLPKDTDLTKLDKDDLNRVSKLAYLASTLYTRVLKLDYVPVARLDNTFGEHTEDVEQLIADTITFR